MDHSSLPALRGILNKSEQTKRRAEAFFDLFVFESARYLLEKMREVQDEGTCVKLFEQYLSECAPAEDEKQTVACRLALEICTIARVEGINLPVFHMETLPFPTDLCYVKNRFTETLLPLLEDEITIYYAEDFEDACRRVKSGERQGCLLPFMGADRLPLQGISRLIDEFDLKKCRLFHVDDGEQDTVYLLVSSDLRPPEDADSLEIMAASSRKRIEAVLSLCERQGLLCDLPAPLQGISDPAPKSDVHFCRFTLRGKRVDLALFYGVLRLCLPESALCGLYDRAELNE